MDIQNNNHTKTVLADGREITYEKTKVMGILNITPDSFYERSRVLSEKNVLTSVETMLNNGVDIIDIGGESSRPGSEPVSEELEIQRVEPVISAVKKEFPKAAIISIDTYRAKTAQAAINAGADIINDISAMTFDENMIEVVKKYDVPIVFMHIKGTPKNMQSNPVYKDDVIEEIYQFLSSRVDFAQSLGIAKDKLIIDPGFGFGKTVKHNLTIVKRVTEFKTLNIPVLLGVSRKSTIGSILGDIPASERLEGTIALNSIACLYGADIIRVHDVKENVNAIKMVEAIKNN